MKIKLKLFAHLTRYLPANANGNVAELEIDDNTSINFLLEKYKLPPEDVHLVLVNGAFVVPENRDEPLKPQDELAIWPPVAGG